MSPAERVIWGFCRIVSEAMEGIGFAGLVAFIIYALIWGFNRITREEKIENE